VHLVRVALTCALPPHDAVRLVRDDARPFALSGRWAGGGALAGSEPVRIARDDEDPFALLEAVPAVTGAGDGAVGGAWVGFLGYTLARRLETIGPPPPDPVGLPPFALAFYDHVVRCDAAGAWWFEALWNEARAPALERRLALLRERAAAPPAAAPFATSPWRATPGPVGHGAAVAAAVERIHHGDLFQANLALSLDATLAGAPADLHVRGTRALAPDRAAFLAGPWGALASLSPELFLARTGREVRSAPIKGTRPAGEGAALAASEKDRAENVMIVDLVRNDLGRVCAPGSVRVTALAQVRPHVGVAHLVSEVAGTLRAEVRDADLVRAAFPPASVTGAPKLAAMDAIASLESTQRGAYTGAIGFASPFAGLELSVPIRTFEIRGAQVRLAVGGGVVADSQPEAEVAEALTKAKPLLAALGATLAPGATRAPAAPPPRLGPRPVPRPDPATGVFETVRVQAGTALAGDAHLARLAASVRALYGRALPEEARERLRAAALRLGEGRLRLDVVPRADGLHLATRVGPPPSGSAPPRLAPVTVPGGLGEHKWVDRRLLDALAAHVAPAVALLVDLDGLVLEAARASLLLVLADGALATPPLDGRILPGVARERALRAARELGLEVRETPLPLEALADAREVILTNALRVEAVRPGPVTAALRERLRQNSVVATGSGVAA